MVHTALKLVPLPRMIYPILSWRTRTEASAPSPKPGEGPSETSLPFFKDLYSTAAVGSYSANSTAAVKTYADGFVVIVQKYTPADGSLAEQFGRHDGAPLSAVDLTWSYASFLTATDRRRGAVPKII
ncbi:glycoside hydrolase 15 protein [Pseudogymnoascus destructans]|uniref:glucan 1,4-alpha-glucosidase n=1 Tax=Pseudogymnoascus destructans TaxID=655981 RepID=A0A176ZZ99_9PEZI|nr:glycoside hydrolase 15 protein [Pseudogymnoascus destructans]OAF55218.1 glycoside hydrolase 15 protein [Pseudogymnoascus destructans]